MATRTDDIISLVLSCPQPSQTRRIYERRRQALLVAVALLQDREEQHHLAATRHEDLTDKDPRWNDAAALGEAIGHVGRAMEALGLTAAEADALLAKRA